jgi:predicted glycosyltransferase
MGLGHLRRNLLAAHALACSPLQAIPLLVAGVREATAFALPPSADCLTLPALRKSEDGQYEARNLDVSITDVIEVRARVIRAAIDAFEPDVLIVDNVPRGALKEVEPTLKGLRAKGDVRCVLGLRDVLDDPASAQKEWTRLANEDAIREYYDEVWVYADPTVYNLVTECHLSPEVAAKVRFVGYLDQRERLALAPKATSSASAFGLRSDKFVLCSVGGGQDGALLAEVFAQADLPPDTSGVILTGPFMSAEAIANLRQIAAANPFMHVLEFCPEPAQLVRDAERIVIMGGYNSVCEALSFEKPALIVPRVKPRLEQFIRARAMHSLGLVDMLHPDQLSPRALTRWLVEDKARPQVHGRIDFNALSVLPAMLQRLLARQSNKSINSAA